MVKVRFMMSSIHVNCELSGLRSPSYSDDPVMNLAVDFVERNLRGWQVARLAHALCGSHQGALRPLLADFMKQDFGFK
jgi:hypothetical protein